MMRKLKKNGESLSPNEEKKEEKLENNGEIKEENGEGITLEVPQEEKNEDDYDKFGQNRVQYTTSEMKQTIMDELTKPYMAFGVLESMQTARDVKIDKFNVTLQGVELIKDTSLELNYGRRYGLIGLNGSGKSTMLKCIGDRLIPIPLHMDIFILSRECEPSEKTPLECVTENVEVEVARIEDSLNILLANEGDDEEIQDLYKRLDELDPDTAQARAGKILFGLGFNKEMQNKPAKDFSGGWRMRIALARALFVSPNILLLDEPTNHLDLEATIWLENYLANYGRILVIISHSQDFLNNVCTNIIHLHKKILKYYNGNFDSYVRGRLESEGHQMKKYYKEQNDIEHMKNYIARFGHGNKKMARQAKSKEKVLVKMVDRGLTELVVKDKLFSFKFNECGSLPPPVMQFRDVSFGYENNPPIYKHLEISLELDSRIALVGPNGAGKSTLLKLIAGELTPNSGMIRSHPHLRIARFHQHLTDLMDLSVSPLDYMIKEFPDVAQKEEIMRKQIGRYGITGKAQLMPMGYLSDGQRSRVVFAWLTFKEPHLLLLDEPTNHLDIETIDALADAINEWDGGVMLVSHDFRLIDQVAEEIWVCNNGRITKWEGDIMSYKDGLKNQIMEDYDQFE